MSRKSNCKKCIHCVYVDKESLDIKCDLFGRTREKYICMHYLTDLEYKTALESLKILELNKEENK